MSITVQADTYAEAIRSLSCVSVRDYNVMTDDYNSAAQRLEKLERELARAKADLASETIVVMERTARCEELAQKLADLDPGEHDKNKALFNVNDLQREYKRGHDDARAECAQERAYAKETLVDALSFKRVELRFVNGTTIEVTLLAFAPYSVARDYAMFFGTHHEIRDLAPDAVGIICSAGIIGNIVFYTPDEIRGWRALAPENKKA